ncbi:hypothetical protein BU14_0099s0033 [Porphyra umbilicalis]|uniref:Uncharacterized protein n=1 Tax=Porphyra umbilicalis TaxID=2786 RepID=A0A1X6PD19_PORUM|nr:hypothetical protein BU14_0099s0033 [Porphyra umbilicalis]|eukprot:OSX78768.1 hypothetical protein BU14_0099s0033 [Porphyra umbilicalis]
MGVPIHAHPAEVEDDASLAAGRAPSGPPLPLRVWCDPASSVSAAAPLPAPSTPDEVPAAPRHRCAPTRLAAAVAAHGTCASAASGAARRGVWRRLPRRRVALPSRVPAPPVSAAGTAAAVRAVRSVPGRRRRRWRRVGRGGARRVPRPCPRRVARLRVALRRALPAPRSPSASVASAALLHAATLPRGGVTAAVAGDDKAARLGPPVAAASGNATV